MNFTFSVENNPISVVTLALRTVYCLHADHTYDVTKKGVQNRDIVALRTMGGRGMVAIEGCGEIAAFPGTLLFFEHDRVRRYFCDGGAWDFWWFEFAAAEMPNFPMNRLMHIEAPENEPGDFTACLDLLGRASAGTARLASAAFSLLLSKWMLQIECGKPENPHRVAVDQALKYMRANINRRISVDSLAREAGLCERRFRQVFMELTGVQPKKYLETLRIAIAEELLLNTSFPIGDISGRLGYSSQFHFCKAFRAARGVPPSQFRANGVRQAFERSGLANQSGLGLLSY